MAEERIGGAWFGLSVNSQEFDAQMRAAEATARTTTQGIGGGFDSANKSAKGFGDSIKGSTAGVQAIISAGSRLLGVVGLITTAATALGDIVNAKTKAAIDNMHALNDALEKIAKMQDQLAARNGEDSASAYARQQNQAYQDMLKQLQEVYENPKLSNKSKEDLSKQIRDIFQGPGGVFQTIDRETGDAALREVFRAEQARMEFSRRLSAERIQDEKASFDAFAEYEKKRQDVLTDSARARETEERRLSQLRIENIRREEEYRRSLTQGFGVGDVATTDLGSLTRAIQDLASTQIQTRD